MTIRLAFNETDNAETVYYKAIWSDKQDKIIAWEVYRNVSHEDSIHTYPRSFDKSNKNVYWLDATKNDLGVLYIAPFDSPLNRTVLYTPQKSEISDIFDHPTEYT
uniref:Dipeptidylpeptidase IV N-terminal domain-containing protein n=1 Tax=Plectus sambesii TaxID=2011161 RepID=A0A914VCS3_9BILA